MDGSASGSGEAGRVVVDRVVKTFDGTVAVDDVSLSIERGEFLTLLGPSGCGKTTLLRIIAGFEQPTGGRVLIGGDDMTRHPPEDRPVNMVFQRYALFPHLTVAENVAYGLRAIGMASANVTQRVADTLDLVAMASFAQRSVQTLSGGQQQRVALARALVKQPQVLLLDEPLAALDLQLRRRMQLELRSIHRQLGTTFIAVTHDQGEALTVSDRVAVMAHGKIAQVGEPEAVYHTPQSRFVASFVGEGSFLPSRIVSSRAGFRTVVLDGGNRQIEVSAPDTVPQSGRAAVMVRPEAVALCAVSDGLLTGRLDDVMFTGAVHRCIVVTPEGAEIKSDVNRAGSFVVGDDVGVTWSPADSVVVESET